MNKIAKCLALLALVSVVGCTDSPTSPYLVQNDEYTITWTHDSVPDGQDVKRSWECSYGRKC